MSADWRSGVSLGPVMQAGDVWIAGVARWHVGAYGSGAFVMAEGAKTPVALLVDAPGGRQALAPDGRPLSPAALADLLPGAWDAFDAAVRREKISAGDG